MKTYLFVAVLTYAGVTALAFANDPVRWGSALVGAVAIFLLLPVVMAAAVTSVSVLLGSVLVTIAVVARPGQTTGVREVLAELAGIGPSILPAYFQRLSEVRSPRVWGVATGLALAALHLTVFVLGGPASSG